MTTLPSRFAKKRTVDNEVAKLLLEAQGQARIQHAAEQLEIPITR